MVHEWFENEISDAQMEDHKIHCGWEIMNDLETLQTASSM